MNSQVIALFKGRLLALSALLTLTTVAATSCRKEGGNDDQPFYKINHLQPRVGQVLWNADEFDFEESNSDVIELYASIGELEAGACTSWRNGHFHGRNFDWMQSDFGCLVLQMPAGKGVKHASVSIINGSFVVDGDLLTHEYIDKEYFSFIPCMAVDGINDAGVTANVNIIHHDPGDKYIDSEEGDLSSSSVVRYILDNAGSVDEAISLLSERKICQDLVNIAEDETHFMISDAQKTAAVEFDNGKMVVVYYHENGHGCYSDKGNPAIMTNLCNYAVENWGLGTDDFYENKPFSLGVERWQIVKDKYDTAAKSLNDNYDIAKSVWYFKNYMSGKSLWYSENGDEDYGKDEQGWFCILDDERIACSGWKEAQQKAWETMPEYWAEYDEAFGQLDDPHVEENDYWETSHTVIYDMLQKKGYLCAFEGFYSKDAKPIEITLPD